MNEEQIDIAVVIKFLKAIGFYDSKMKQDEMISLYNEVKSAESTEREPAVNRTITLTPKEKSPHYVDKSGIFMESNNFPSTSGTQFKPKSWTPQNKQLSLLTASSTKQRSIEECPNVDVYDSNPTEHKPLGTKHHEPKYSEPYYCQRLLNELPLKQITRQIIGFHIKVNSRYHRLQRHAKLAAAQGSDINQCISSSKHRMKTALEEARPLSPTPEETCTSRSGRIIKRKLYNEYVSSDDEADVKKVKAETPKAAKPSNSRVPSLRDWKQPCEELFDMMIEEDKQKNKVGVDRSHMNDDDFDIKVTSSRSLRPVAPALCEPVAEEDGFVRKRIVPAVPGRKGYKRQKIVPETKIINEDVIGISDSKESKSKQQVTKCPICNNTFSLLDIEEHASSCGLTAELEIENNLPMHTEPGVETLTCAICDKTFLVNTDYEVHVNLCIRRQNQKVFL